MTMLRRINWRIVLGVIFLVGGVLLLIDHRWVDAGFNLLLSIGSFIVAYSQKYPERSRGPLAWGVTIVWAVLLIGLIILQFRQ